ncbi:unnamed protein product [Orchesella dallaii]|uniref:Uncharacterized protein n=1 Tax=Orchesella dallaii TaxID=48710 RepID=A0ABP1R1L2_9HEXA
MKSSQACLELSADCNLCIGESCFFVQLESGMWMCVNKLAGLQDVMRVIPPHFPEYCERVSASGSIFSIPNQTPLGIDNGNLSTFVWIFSLSNAFLLLLFLAGFWFLCYQHRNLYRAIEEIPEIVNALHIKKNNYFDQLRQQNENDTLAEINETGINNKNNPFLAIECSPVVHPTSQHIQLEMEELPPIVLPPSPNTSPESSPEVMPSVGTVTRSGRAINPPDFFRA